jgi:hypothetical protein
VKKRKRRLSKQQLTLTHLQAIKLEVYIVYFKVFTTLKALWNAVTFSILWWHKNIKYLWNSTIFQVCQYFKFIQKLNRINHLTSITRCYMGDYWNIIWCKPHSLLLFTVWTQTYATFQICYHYCCVSKDWIWTNIPNTILMYETKFNFIYEPLNYGGLSQ